MRRLVVVVLGLALVLVGLDFAARAAAEAAVARQLQTTQGLPKQPDVQVRGFPFLTQVAQGTYRDVDVRLQQLAAGGYLRLDEVDARLLGVHLPLTALFGSGPRAVPVDDGEVVGKIGFATLDAQVSAVIPGNTATVTFADGGGGRLRATLHYTGAGGPLTLTGAARLSIDRGRLTVSLPRNTVAQVPQQLRGVLTPLLTQTIQLPRLPLGLVATSVTATAYGISVTTRARHTDLLAH
jgi:hypothetical protein